MRFRTVLALFTLAFAAACVAIIGLDRWIVTVWLLVGGVLLVLAVLGFFLGRELDVRPRRPQSSLPWAAGAIAAFISCTMAAGIVRAAAPLQQFWLLGILMALGLVCLRLAYHPTPGGTAGTTRSNNAK